MTRTRSRFCTIGKKMMDVKSEYLTDCKRLCAKNAEILGYIDDWLKRNREECDIEKAKNLQQKLFDMRLELMDALHDLSKSATT